MTFMTFMTQTATQNGATKMVTTSEKRKRGTKLSRAVIQRRYRARKSSRKVQVRWDVNPETLVKIFRDCHIKVPNLQVATSASVSKSSKSSTRNDGSR
jgi:hypothetical protein